MSFRASWLPRSPLRPPGAEDLRAVSRKARGLREGTK